MPKRKKVPNLSVYTGLNADPSNATIQKSNPLMSLSETNLSLSELKILDAYLARINSHVSNKRTVIFAKGELEELLGVTRILKPDLKNRLKNLFQVVEIKDPENSDGISMISLFEEASAEQDENGLWEIHLTCSPAAKKYIFHIENIGYLKYRLKNVIHLTSRYSYVMFLYLEQNRYRKSWEISLEELKTMLRCTGSSYEQFKIFNDRVLKLVSKELNNKTQCQFTYKPLRKGRKVSSILFEVTQNAEAEIESFSNSASYQLENEQSELLDEYTEPGINSNFHGEIILHQQIDNESEELALMSSACNDEFSAEEIEVLLSVIRTMNLPRHENGIEFARYHYLNQKYAYLNLLSKKGKIKHRFSYLQQMIKNDVVAGSNS